MQYMPGCPTLAGQGWSELSPQPPHPVADAVSPRAAAAATQVTRTRGNEREEARRVKVERKDIESSRGRFVHITLHAKRLPRRRREEPQVNPSEVRHL
jgi:hypothetical protein